MLVGDNKLFTLRISTADALMRNTQSSLMRRYARLGKQRLKTLYKQLEINDSYFVDELELFVEHWVLKESDLFKILHAAYIPVGF